MQRWRSRTTSFVDAHSTDSLLSLFAHPSEGTELCRAPNCAGDVEYGRGLRSSADTDGTTMGGRSEEESVSDLRHWRSGGGTLSMATSSIA
eukprot:833224-Prymnesium_polylepis.2